MMMMCIRWRLCRCFWVVVEVSQRVSSQRLCTHDSFRNPDYLSLCRWTWKGYVLPPIHAHPQPLPPNRPLLLLPSHLHRHLPLRSLRHLPPLLLLFLLRQHPLPNPPPPNPPTLPAPLHPHPLRRTHPRQKPTQIFPRHGTGKPSGGGGGFGETDVGSWEEGAGEGDV